jgi:hypothetical protein
MFATAEEIEDKAITVRPASMAVFGVDSDDRYRTYAERRTNTTYPFSFQVTKNEALLNGFFTRLAVTEFRMYWTLPNISAAWGNNTLEIFITGGAANPYTITIPDGSYDLQTLNATIQDLVQVINDGGPPLLPNFAAVTNVEGSSFYSSSSATTWYWVRPTSNVRTLYDMLNLVNTYPETASVNHSGGVANLRSTDYIDIVSPQLTYNQDLKDGSTATLVRDMLVRIYLDDGVNGPYRTNTKVFGVGPPLVQTELVVPQYDPTDYMNGTQPFTIYRQFQYPKQVQWNKTQPLGNITFTMYDDQGRSIQDLWASTYPTTNQTGQYYANSFVWNMTLLISES